MRLDKNREESFAHHAVDALLIVYSQMGYNTFRKLQGEFIDFETGEILNPEMWKENMTDEVYEKCLYGQEGQKWLEIRNNIKEAEKHVKYWHKVDKNATVHYAIKLFTEQEIWMVGYIRLVKLKIFEV